MDEGGCKCEGMQVQGLRTILALGNLASSVCDCDYAGCCSEAKRSASAESLCLAQEIKPLRRRSCGPGWRRRGWRRALMAETKARLRSRSCLLSH
jgi:hypothetical protein